jgi:2-polyprenyl-3-methyl-5-hydroxy-6-metoxy-1,4-benzoquinol methylase
MRTTDGLSIYEDANGTLFNSQADYYLDEGARDAAAAKLEWVTQFTRPGGRLLDVGANVGLFVREAKSRYDAVGIEPSAAAVKIAEENAGSSVEVGSIYEAKQSFKERFNVITLFDVIEHLDDPRRALERCRENLAPGGRLFLTTPNSASAVARLLGARWYHLDLTQHISVFSARNLSRMLADCGFRVVSQRTFGRRYRFSYIERRLREQGRDNGLLRAAHVAAIPMRLLPRQRVSINLGDVMGIVAELRDGLPGQADGAAVRSGTRG